MKIRHAIFDLDGTLTESNGVWVDAVFHYIDTCCPYKREDLPEIFFSEVIFGGTFEALEFLRDTMGDTTDFGKITEVVMEKVCIGYSAARPMKKGALEFVKKLKKIGADICIVSATPSYLVEKALDLCGILPYVDFIISGDERKSGKEKPYIFLEAAARMNCEPNECVLFEDALYSIRTGKALGMKVVGIEDEFCKPEVWEQIKGICDVYTNDYSVLTVE